MELVDSVDLGSSAKACRFESCRPHQIPVLLWQYRDLLFFERSKFMSRDSSVMAVKRAIGGGESFHGRVDAIVENNGKPLQVLHTMLDICR